MSKQKKSYDPKELFLRGLLAFGNLFSSGYDRPTYSGVDALKRSRSHAKFKAQCAARRAQRKLRQA